MKTFRRRLLASVLASTAVISLLALPTRAGAEYPDRPIRMIIPFPTGGLTEILGRRGICLRAGHHCTQPLHLRLGISASVRLSVGIYNTIEEIERVAPAILDALELFNKSS